MSLGFRYAVILVCMPFVATSAYYLNDWQFLLVIGFYGFGGLLLALWDKF